MGRLKQSVILILLVIALLAGTLVILNPTLQGLVIGVAPPHKETGNWSVHFCPRENCMEFLDDALAEGGKVECAFYSINLYNTTHLLEEKNALVFVDNSTMPASYKQAIPLTVQGLMHHKFCVLDSGVVTTGSFNPTFQSNNQDNNDLFIISSPYLAQNYAAEIQYLAGNAVTTPFPKVMHNGFLIENYFCPRDDCESRILDAMGQAKRSVYFMEYTFTSNPIEGELTTLHRKGLAVEGVIEKFQSANKDTYLSLSRSGIDVWWDGNPKLMHHKVMIIDNSTVVFGSFNPTAAANTINRENVLIIHDPAIAQKFLEEYVYVKGQAQVIS